MKKYRYNTTAFLVITLLTISSTIFAAEATKEYHKEFTANQNTTLDINSKYGNVVIESWNENRIVIDVKITVNMPNKDRAEQTLGYIDVIFTESSNVVKAVTNFNSRFDGRNNNSVSVDYTIKMPATIALNLENRYGNATIINGLSGLVKLNVRYGNLKIDRLTRGNEKPWNNITLAYGNGDIETAGWLTLNAQYVTNFKISECTAVLLDSRYSTLNFGNISSIVGESRYGAITIGNIRNLDLDKRYTTTKIETLTNSLKFKSSYGALTINNVPAGFELIDVETRYAAVILGIDDNASYELNGSARYGGIKYNENNFNIRQRIQQNNSLTIAGTMGNETSPKSTVKIDASYSTVTLGR